MTTREAISEDRADKPDNWLGSIEMKVFELIGETGEVEWRWARMEFSRRQTFKSEEMDGTEFNQEDTGVAEQPVDLGDVVHELRALRAVIAGKDAELLTAAQAARFLGIGRTKLHQLASLEERLK